MEIIVLTIGFAILLILIPFYNSPIVCLAGVIIGGVVGVSVVRIAMKDIEMGRFWLITQLIGGVIMAVLWGFIIKSQTGPSLWRRKEKTMLKHLFIGVIMLVLYTLPAFMGLIAWGSEIGVIFGGVVGVIMMVGFSIIMVKNCKRFSFLDCLYWGSILMAFTPFLIFLTFCVYTLVENVLV